MQVAFERVPVGSLIVGVDLVPIRPVRGAVSIEADITKPECRSSLKRIMSSHGCRAFDLILHDGSPNVGGRYSQEATSQNSLVIDSVKLATDLLAPKGNFLTKVFRSQDYSAVLYCLRQLFEKVEVTKPPASRQTSSEIYIVALKYKAPAKIDPRLLDIRHLFQGATEPQKVVDVLRATKQKRHRDGYKDGETLVRKVCSAADFVWCNTPLDILGSVTSITFKDPSCSDIKDHALTTEEVKSLCDDLGVLGKPEFKNLLKWRNQIRKALSPTEKVTSTAADAEDGKEEDQDEDEKELQEMEEKTSEAKRKKERAKKRLAKRLAKEKARKAAGMQVDALEDGYVDHELFSLASIKGKKELVAVDSTEFDDENGDLGDSENEETREESQGSLQSDLDSDEERQRYDELLDEYLDEAYEQIAAKREAHSKQRKRAKQNYSKDDPLLEGDNDDSVIHSHDESDKDDGDTEANPLVVALEEGPTQEAITEKWFSQGIFSEAVKEGDFKKYESEEDDMQLDTKKEEKLPAPKAKEEDKLRQPPSKNRPSEADNDFEIVPAPATDSSDDSSSDESEDDNDVDTKAEILACAKKMLRKKQREQMLDDAYNKYMFDDEGLPRWFLDEEKTHRQPIKPVTKEEIAAMKAQFKDIDARPAKKVAQAKARKKRVAMRKLEKVRKKANSISDQTDISDRSKRKMIDQLYKKATPKRPQKEYVVAKKGVQVKGGKGKILVDRRMKKDARSKQGKGDSLKKGKNSKAKKVRGGAKGKKGKKGKNMSAHD